MMTAPFRARLRALLARFVAARDGVSAVEFALILPVMLVLYAGVVDLTDVLTVHRKADRVTATVADLVTQESTVTSAKMLDIFKASRAIMEPYSPEGMQIRMLVIDLSTNPDKVKCSKTFVDVPNSSSDTVTTGATGGTTPIAVDPVFGSTGDVVIAQVIFTYASPFTEILNGTPAPSYVTWTSSGDYRIINRTYLAKPRLGTTITCE